MYSNFILFYFIFYFIYTFYFLFYFLFFFFFCTRLIKFHGFSKCLSVLYKKKSHCLYGEKRKFRPYIGTKLQVLYIVYMEELFFQDFCAILTKIKGVSNFVSIPYCLMDYCIPPYCFFFLLFFFFVFFLLLFFCCCFFVFFF